MPHTGSDSARGRSRIIEELFVHRDAIGRHLSAPMLSEREAFLASLFALGRKKKRVSAAASLVCQVIRLVEPMNRNEVTEDEIGKASVRWINESEAGSCDSRYGRGESFRATARAWFRFLGSYVPPSQPFCRFRGLHAEFVTAMRDQFGYLPASVEASSLPTLRFLVWVSERHEHLSAVNQNDVDTFLDAGRKRGWAHRTVRCNCQALRTFFRYAEQRGWSYEGLSKTIKAPTMSVPVSPLPSPSWKSVRLLIDALDASNPAQCRAKAILLLASVYGMRSCEISRLTLEEIDWENEILTVRRAKRGRLQQFPLQYEVGQCIIDYLRKVRPQSRFTNVFLTLHAPHRPVHHLAQSMWRLLRLGAFLDTPCGMHSLRHACATELLRQGTSLQAIADLLGHRGMRSVSVYAHCDWLALCKVADFSLRDVS